ncbi:sodium/potassium-transporting ATPase subunit beta-1-like [Watersipora subatra]|uniref:sodium/potassium-transporting ATPase subunit beta-1-like n=1 Tax=Watersipora subatra TaxID=2589382 RepID=UPI00355B445B
MAHRVRSGTNKSVDTLNGIPRKESTAARTTYSKNSDNESIYESIVNFLASAYNSETQEFLGRTALGWALILSFYIVFYMSLALIYSGMWFLWREVILNADSPKYSGPEDGLAWSPGVSHVPIIDPDRKSTLIRFSRSNDTQTEELANFMYDNFLKFYEPDYWTSANGNFIDCTSGRTDDDIEKVCEFKLDDIRPCTLEDGYGWGDGQPCIILKLNKVNNWWPENYNESEVPDEIKDVWQKNVITLNCYGSDPVSRESIGAIEYYPMQGWSFDYYPFTGQQGYKSPLVAVQFMELPHRMAVFITCKAYTKNMVYHASYGLGMTQFEIISD